MNAPINFFNELIESWERPASWRFLSAIKAAASNNTQLVNYDSYTIAMLAILKDDYKHIDGEEVNSLELYNSTRAAYVLWQDLDMRWVLNGYILARATDAQLVKRFSYSIAIFEQYRNIFFDVGAVRDHDDLLDNVLALEHFYSNASQEDLGWQHIALTCDVEAFDVYIQDVEGNTDTATKDKLKVLATQGAMRKALTISMKASLVDYDTYRVLELGAGPMHIEQQSTLDMEKAELDSLVGSLLHSVPYKLIKTDDKLPSNAGEFRAVCKMNHRHAKEVNKIKQKAKLDASQV